MTKQEKLIEYYTRLLARIREEWAGYWDEEKGNAYIAEAEKNLAEVKAGRKW